MTNAAGSTDRMTDKERAELAAYEHLVEQPELARGLALRVIRDMRLYRESFETFEQYCVERWKLSKTHVNRLIKGAEVLKNLAPIGVTDLKEGQARELIALSPEDQQLVVRFVKGTAPDGRITAGHLRSTVNVVRDVMTAGAIDDGSGIMVQWDELPAERKRALLEANLTEDTYERHQRQREHVNQILRSSNTNEWFTPARIVDAARAVLGSIDIDPASCVQANQTVRAKTFYDKEHDGFTQVWEGW